jgi:MFS family permease
MIAGCTGTSNLFSNMAYGVTPILLYREVGLSPAIVGIVFGLANTGFLLGAAMAGRLPRRFGLGPAIVFSSFVGGPAVLIVAFLPSNVPIAAGMLFVSGFVGGWGQVVYNVNQVSYRQAITPPEIQGRMNATMRFIVWGTIPIGSVLGGIIATLLSVRGAILIGGIGSCLAFLWVLFSPVRSLQTIPMVEASNGEAAVPLEPGFSAAASTASTAAEAAAAGRRGEPDDAEPDG